MTSRKRFRQGDVVIYDSATHNLEAYFDQYAEHDSTGAYIYPINGSVIGLYVNPNSLTLEKRGTR